MNLSKKEVAATGQLSRMDVSPDGSHVAFITNQQLTGYENHGRRRDVLLRTL